MSSPLLERIAPLIDEILRSPSIVPSQINAKTVRKALVNEHNVDGDALLKEKQAVNELILNRFREIYPAENGQNPAENTEITQGINSMELKTPLKRKRDASPAGVAASSPAQPLADLPKRSSTKIKADTEKSDAEYAQKLQDALNGDRSTRSAGSSTAKRRKVAGDGAKGKKGKFKSKAYIDGDDEDDEDGNPDESSSKKKRAKEGSSGGGGGGFSQPLILSDELAAVLEADQLSRPQVVKQLWVYIKSQGLQDKKIIKCDEKLQRVFKVPEIDMFQMNKVLSNHLRKPNE